MKVVNYVQIDFSKNKDITVPSMQYDSGSRWVRLKLFNNGIPVNLNGIRVCIMVAKPDGKEVFNDCVIVDAENGLVEFEITNQMVVVAGEVECQIKLMEQDKLLSSEIFTLFVNKGLTPTNIDSENELNVLVDALNRVEHLDQELSGEIMASFEASQTQRDETFKEKLLEYDERFLEIKGEKGDKGDKGDTGERGLQGPVGPQGSKGDVGEQGPVGPQGPKGDKGDQGEVGAIGPIGLQGPIGLTGPQGETGPQGPKGEKGLDGRSVELGVYGGQVKWRYAGQEENVGWTPLISLDSLRGSQGPQGEKGETGPQGPKGEKGDSGGVMPADMVDYMGNQHETLKAKNDADVDWLLGEINTAHYEGQQITATDSIEGRAKSAILKGQTLVNLCPNKVIDYIATSDWDGFNGLGQNSNTQGYSWKTLHNLKPNTKYFISCHVERFDVAEGQYYLLNNSNNSTVFEEPLRINTTGTHKWVLTSKSEFTEGVFIVLRCQNAYARGAIKIRDIMLIEYQDGMENWDLKYFEGMKSVRMPVLTTTGKNLFNGILTVGSLNTNGSFNNAITDRIVTDYIKLGNGTFTESNADGLSMARRCIYDKDKNFIREYSSSKTFTLSNNEVYIRTCYLNTANINAKIQVEQGSQATAYEPHKTNILSTSEDVTLRKIGDVQDALDCLTGEVTQRVGEVVLDGSEDEEWNYWNSGTTLVTGFYSNVPLNNAALSSHLVICDKIPSTDAFISGINKENIFSSSTGRINLNILNSKATTVDELKTYLSSNPITVQYRLAEKVIKTVDLSDYHVYSFKDTTHYSCGSEDGSLIPSLSIDVPTNLPALVSRQRATIESQKEQIQTLEVENEILTNEIQRVDEKGEQADLEQLSMTWEIDYRVSEVEWFLEDNLSSTLLVAEKINLKLGGNTMALSRFEQAKILILAGAYNRETLEKQLTNYLKRGYLTTEEYDELIALMDAKELVSEN